MTMLLWIFAAFYLSALEVRSGGQCSITDYRITENGNLQIEVRDFQTMRRASCTALVHYITRGRAFSVMGARVIGRYSAVGGDRLHIDLRARLQGFSGAREVISTKSGSGRINTYIRFDQPVYSPCGGTVSRDLVLSNKLRVSSPKGSKVSIEKIIYDLRTSGCY